MLSDPLVSAAILDRPDVQRVEKLVGQVYIDLYGPNGWASRKATTRAAIVQVAIDLARVDGRRALVHTDKKGQSYYLEAADIVAALEDTSADENGSNQP